MLSFGIYCSFVFFFLSSSVGPALPVEQRCKMSLLADTPGNKWNECLFPESLIRMAYHSIYYIAKTIYKIKQKMDKHKFRILVTSVGSKGKYDWEGYNGILKVINNAFSLNLYKRPFVYYPFN